MPKNGNFTVDLNGFIQFLSFEHQQHINQVIDMIKNARDEITRIQDHELNPRPGGFARFFGCWMRRRRHIAAIPDNYYESRIKQINERIAGHNKKLDELTRRRNFILSPEFRETMLGACPICFDDFSASPDTSMIPECMHPICLDCFKSMMQKKIWDPLDPGFSFAYKCPMCCGNSISFYEVCFCASSTA